MGWPGRSRSQLQELAGGVLRVAVPGDADDLRGVQDRPAGLPLDPDQPVRPDRHGGELVALGGGEADLADSADHHEHGSRLADQRREQIADRLTGHSHRLPRATGNHAPPQAAGSMVTPGSVTGAGPSRVGRDPRGGFAFRSPEIQLAGGSWEAWGRGYGTAARRGLRGDRACPDPRSGVPDRAGPQG